MFLPPAPPPPQNNPPHVRLFRAFAPCAPDYKPLAAELETVGSTLDQLRVHDTSLAAKVHRGLQELGLQSPQPTPEQGQWLQQLTDSTLKRAKTNDPELPVEAGTVHAKFDQTVSYIAESPVNGQYYVRVNPDRIRSQRVIDLEVDVAHELEHVAEKSLPQSAAGERLADIRMAQTFGRNLAIQSLLDSSKVDPDALTHSDPHDLHGSGGLIARMTNLDDFCDANLGSEPVGAAPAARAPKPRAPLPKPR